MTDESNPNSQSIMAVRCHDITVNLGDMQVSELDKIVLIGMAVRLALHLRGVPAVDYPLLKNVGLHLLHIPPVAMKAVIDLLAEVEFLKVDSRGNTIRSIIPTVPFYEDMFDGIGEYAANSPISEAERLTLAMIQRLATSPAPVETIYNMGAEKGLVDSMIELGGQGGYLLSKRARGRNMLVTPMYFSENMHEFADLAAGTGSSKLGKVIKLLSENQGWPLNLIRQTRRLGETILSDEDINIILKLAGDGFAPPPVIETSHAGMNHFIFAPKPGLARIGPTKRPVYEAAMALVAAVRQGQLLPARYKINYPEALLQALKVRKSIGANSEAMEQYRKLAILKMGRLVKVSGDRYKFELIDRPENVEAVELAIQMVKGNEPAPGVEEEAILAFKSGHSYVDSLVGRQRLVKQEKPILTAEAKKEIDDYLLEA